VKKEIRLSKRSLSLPVLWEVEACSVSQPVLPAQLSSDFPFGKSLPQCNPCVKQIS